MWRFRCGSSGFAICWRWQPGQLIESQWGNGEDVPLASGEVQLAWSEFEVIDTELAVRITRLA